MRLEVEVEEREDILWLSHSSGRLKRVLMMGLRDYWVGWIGWGK